MITFIAFWNIRKYYIDVSICILGNLYMISYQISLNIFHDIMFVWSSERWLHHDIYIYVISVWSFEKWLHHDIYIYICYVCRKLWKVALSCHWHICTYIYMSWWSHPSNLSTDIYVEMKPPFNGRCRKCDTWFVMIQLIEYN